MYNNTNIVVMCFLIFGISEDGVSNFELSCGKHLNFAIFCKLYLLTVCVM